MPKITITRPYEWVNQKIRIKVFIDDKHVGHVGIGKTVHFEVTPGKHTLMLKDQWPARSTSLDVDLSDNQDKTINMSTYKRRFWAPFLMALLVGMGYPIVRSSFNMESNWPLDILVFASMFVAVLIALSATEYIKLEEEKE